MTSTATGTASPARTNSSRLEDLLPDSKIGSVLGVCDVQENLQVHHIRNVADLNRPNRRDGSHDAA